MNASHTPVAAFEPQSLEAATLRIFSPVGAPVAGGFLVTSQLALTCAHAVVNALAADQDASSPEGAVITVDLPLLARPGQGGAPLTATVEKWIPEQPSGAGDVAVLRLSEPVEAAGPVRLITARTVWRHEARAFGFPDGHPAGAWHVGLLLAREENGWVQMNQDPAAGGFPVSRGFSGAPVWDDRLGAVVGMLTAANIGKPPVSYLIPTDRLIAAWEDLAALVVPPSPFRPLAAFEESDTKIFYGRAAESDRVANAVAAAPRTTLVGPSGSGKSSLAKAGVVPRRRAAGDIPVVIRPSQRSSPLHALAAELVPLLDPEQSGLERLEESDRLVGRLARDGLRDVASEVLKCQHGARLLIVLDQFEELLDLPPTHVDALAALLVDARPAAVGVLAALRADFLEPVLAHPRLRALAGENIEILAPMAREQLEQVIKQPIRDTPGVKFEANLAERILEEAGAEPGALPLLAFLLDKLWRSQNSGILTHHAFEDLGGVSGALSAYAKGAWTRLPAQDRPAAHRLLSRLVQVTVETLTATRRVAPREEVPDDEWRIAQRLAATGLLVLNSRLTGASEQGLAVSVESVELAHETLITAWDVLAARIRDNKDFLTWRDTLRHDIKRWTASGHATDLLPTKTALDAAKHWLPARVDELGEAEHEYLRQGRAHHNSRKRRRRAVIAALCVLSLTASIFGAVSARLNADTARATAVTRANALAADAAALEANDPGLAGQLAIAAYHTWPTQAAVSQLYATLNTPLDRVVVNSDVPTLQTTAQSDGPLAAAVDLKGSLRIWDTANPAAPILDATIHAQAAAIALAPHSALMAAACPTVKFLCLWSLTDPRRPTVMSQLPTGFGAHAQSVVESIAFSPDSTLLAAAADNGLVFLWSIAQPAHPRPITFLANPASGPHKDLAAVSFAPRGSLLAATIQDGQTELWNLANPTAPSPVATITTGYQAIAFSPDSTLLAAAGDTHVGLWSLSDPARPAPIDIDSACPPSTGILDNQAVAFSPDGARLAISGSDTTDSRGMLCSLSLDPGNLNPANSSLPTATDISPGFGIQSMAYSATGALLASGHDGTVRLWRWPLEQAQGAAPTDDNTWALNPSTRLMAAPISNPHSVQLALGIWDLTTADPTLDAGLPLPAQLQSVQFLSETTLLTVTHDGATQLWDLHDPHHPNRGVSMGTANFTIATNGYSDATGAPADYILNTGVTADAAGTLVTVAGSDNLLHLWHIDNAQHATEIGSIPVPDTTADYAGTLADGRTVLITTPTEIDWWDIADPAHPKHGGSSPLNGATLSNAIVAGNVFVAETTTTAQASVALHVYGIANGKPRSMVELPGLFDSSLTTALGMSGDGDLLAVTGAGGNTLTLWDTSNPTNPRSLSAIPAGQQIDSIAFDPSASVMIDWNSVGPIQVWDIAAPTAPALEYSLTTPNNAVTSAVFAPSGTMLAIAADGSVSFFDTDPAKLAGRLCSYTGGTITTTQWAQSAPNVPYQSPCPS